MTSERRSRQWLADYKSEQSPTEASLARILDAVEEHALVPPPPHLDVDPRHVPAPGMGGVGVTKLGAALTAKIAVATIAVSVPLLWWTRSHQKPVPEHTVVASGSVQPSPSAPVSAAPPAPTFRLSDLPAFAAPTAAGSGAVTGSPASRMAKKAAPYPASSVVTDSPAADSSASPTEPEIAPDSLTEDVALLTEANRALASGAPDRALALTAEHAVRFPSSALGGERAAIRAMALCQSGRTAEGRAAAAALLRSPSSARFAARLHSACGLP